MFYDLPAECPRVLWIVKVLPSLPPCAGPSPPWRCLRQVGRRRAPRAARRWCCWSAALGVFVVFLDTTIVNIAFPTISRDLAVGAGERARPAGRAYRRPAQQQARGEGRLPPGADGRRAVLGSRMRPVRPVHRRATPHFLAGWLAPTVLIGLGAALTLPVQSATAAQSLPPARFGIGSAVNSSFRQLGAVLGVSVLVAVTASTAGASALAAFHHAWWAFAVIGLAAGAVQCRTLCQTATQGRAPRPRQTARQSRGLCLRRAPGLRRAVRL